MILKSLTNCLRRVQKNGSGSNSLRDLYLKIRPWPYAVIGCLSCGLKSRGRSCPHAFSVPGSSVRAIRGCEFPWRKAAGRSASEPGCSLVIDLKTPTLWPEGEGRCRRVGKTEAIRRVFRGGRGGMLWKRNSAGRETRDGGGAGPPTGAYKARPKSQRAVTGVGGVHTPV